MYYRNAQAALVAYDLTKTSSLVKARHWVAELQRQASTSIVIALVGNKRDLVDENEDGGGESAQNESSDEGGQDTEGDNAEPGVGGASQDGKARKVTTEEAGAFAEDEGLLFFETSARTGYNVTEVFTAIANAIPESALKGRTGAQGAQSAALGGGQQGGAGRAVGEGGRIDLGRGKADRAKTDGCAC